MNETKPREFFGEIGMFSTSFSTRLAFGQTKPKGHQISDSQILKTLQAYC